MPASGGVELSVVLAYTVGLIVAYVLIRALWLPARFALRCAYACLIGLITLALVNAVGAHFAIRLPINPLTVLTAGGLGIPGVILILALTSLL